MLSVKPLSLGFGRNRGEIAEVVVFSAIGDGFQIFGITTVGDANTGDLALLCHVYCLLFFYNRIIRKLISGDPAALLHKPDDAFRVGICLWNLIQCLLCKFLSIHNHHSFGLVFAKERKLCGAYREIPFAVKNCAAVNKEKRFFRNLLTEYIFSAIIQETIWIGVERMRNTSC